MNQAIFNLSIYPHTVEMVEQDTGYSTHVKDSIVHMVASEKYIPE